MTTTPSNASSIAFIGGGNMARSLIGGLINNGFDPDAIRVADPAAEPLAQLRQRFGVQTCPDNATAAEHADVIVLAVKPQVMREAASQLQPTARSAAPPLFISIAAGIREPDLRAWLGNPQAAIVRCMPNTPALLGAGASGLYANAAVSAEQRQLAERIMAAAGLTVWLTDESQLDAVTALSGSGPAYYFYLMEIMEKTGIELGLSAEQARQLTLQTALGAARMALASSSAANEHEHEHDQESPAELRRRVTSPGGTTERALAILQQGGMESLMRQAIVGAAERCRELSDKLSDAGEGKS